MGSPRGGHAEVDWARRAADNLAHFEPLTRDDFTASKRTTSLPMIGPTVCCPLIGRPHLSERTKRYRGCSKGVAAGRMPLELAPP